MVGRCSDIYSKPQRPLLWEPYIGIGCTYMSGWGQDRVNKARETFTVPSSICTGHSHLNVTEESHSGPPYHIQEVRIKSGGSGWWNPVAQSPAIARGSWLEPLWRDPV